MWTDLDLLRDIIFVLATQGWQKVVDESEDFGAIDRLADHFRIPLEKVNTDMDEIHAEFELVLHYATTYISLSTLDYRAVWWKVFNSPDSSAWVNVLNLIELLFSLPVSNGVVERVFSQMNVIKGKKRSSLTNDTLDDLLSISSANLPLSEFDPNEAINLWWNEKIRRPNHSARKPYKKHKTRSTASCSSSSLSTSSSSSVIVCDSDSTTSESDSEPVASKSLLDCWDDWIDSPLETESLSHDPEVIDVDESD